MIVKPRKQNVVVDHLWQIKIGEFIGLLNNQLPYSNLFKVEALSDYFEDISIFLTTRLVTQEYTTTQ